MLNFFWFWIENKHTKPWLNQALMDSAYRSALYLCTEGHSKLRLQSLWEKEFFIYKKTFILIWINRSNNVNTWVYWGQGLEILFFVNVNLRRLQFPLSISKIPCLFKKYWILFQTFLYCNKESCHLKHIKKL